MLSSVDLYFMCQDGSMFKARVPYAPYFYITVRDGAEADVEGYLRRRYEGAVKDFEIVHKEDLDLVRGATTIRKGSTRGCLLHVVHAATVSGITTCPHCHAVALSCCSAKTVAAVSVWTRDACRRIACPV